MNTNYNFQKISTKSENPEIRSIPSGIPFLEYKPGTELDSGNTVYRVLSVSQYHVVYKVKGLKNILYEYVPINHQVQDLVCTITSLINLSEDKFKGTATDKITARIIPIFSLIFLENIGTANQHITELSQYINEKPKISTVIANTHEYTVWLNNENNVEYTYWTSFNHLNLAIAEFTRLRALGSSFISKRMRRKFSEQLGAALVTSIETSKNTTNTFKDTENLVIKLIDNSLRERYVVYTTGTAIILAALILLPIYHFKLSEFAQSCSITILGGIIGSFISVQSRLKTIKCEISDPVWTIVSQAAIRIFIGGIFGFIAFIASQAGLMFSILKESEPGLIILGIVSGFSERLIPELLKSIDSKK